MTMVGKNKSKKCLMYKVYYHKKIQTFTILTVVMVDMHRVFLWHLFMFSNYGAKFNTVHILRKHSTLVQLSYTHTQQWPLTYIKSICFEKN